MKLLTRKEVKRLLELRRTQVQITRQVFTQGCINPYEAIEYRMGAKRFELQGLLDRAAAEALDRADHLNRGFIDIHDQNEGYNNTFIFRFVADGVDFDVVIKGL